MQVFISIILRAYCTTWLITQCHMNQHKQETQHGNQIQHQRMWRRVFERSCPTLCHWCDIVEGKNNRVTFTALGFDYWGENLLESEYVDLEIHPPIDCRGQLEKFYLWITCLLPYLFASEFSMEHKAWFTHSVGSYLLPRLVKELFGWWGVWWESSHGEHSAFECLQRIQLMCCPGATCWANLHAS